MARGNKKQKGKGSQGQNRKNSDTFFEKLRQKNDVVETASGLFYSIIDDQDGTLPTEESSVEVNQRISLIDGTIIADTYKDQPDTFPMHEAIEGYKEGLLMMGEGSRYKLYIPSELAWGKRGAGDKIGPHATLIIDVRLESVID